MTVTNANTAPLQDILPFGANGITSNEQYKQALILVTTADYNPLVERQLTMAISAYEAEHKDQDQQLDDARKVMERLCDTPSNHISFSRYEAITMITLVSVAVILAKNYWV
ncbi:MAG: hypothetical protein HRU23_15115 [Gammaproteobacteria bacterium]|nr:hypothetical protein [Gammaproteobacteria bacterium]